MTSLKNKSVLIYDFGLCSENAVRLARDFESVFYYTPWEAAFPKSSYSLIGKNFEGVTRVDSFEDYKKEVDLICFFDTYCSDIVRDLREDGYRVFGAGASEGLENNRHQAKKYMEEVGLPVQHYELIKGYEALEEYLKKHNHVVVKLNMFRGDAETFMHDTWNTTQAQYMGDLLMKLGAKAEEIEFLVEDEIKGVEPGYDGFVVDGQYSNVSMYGYERKGTGYIGKVMPYTELPKPLKMVNDKIAPYFKKYEGRTFFSTEVMVKEDGTPYLIDPTVRCPMPCPTAIALEMYENFSEFIWEAADGNLIDLEPLYKYGAGICVDSDWAEHHWTHIDFDYKYRQWIKFRMACKIGKEYYALPGFNSVCSVIGLGNTIDECIDKIEEIVPTLKIRESTYTVSGLREILDDVIPEGRKHGIEF